jgi:hypothetical protein
MQDSEQTPSSERMTSMALISEKRRLVRVLIVANGLGRAWPASYTGSFYWSI